MIILLKIFLCIPLIFCFINLCSGEVSEADKMKIEKETVKMYKKSCCPKDFLMLVMTKWESCQNISCWKYDPGKEPYVVCRMSMFNKSGPCNKERRSKCTDRKDEWLKCIKNVVEKENKGMKPECTNNDTVVANLPAEKLLCYNMALADIKSCDN